MYIISYLWSIAPQYWVCPMLGQCHEGSSLRGPKCCLVPGAAVASHGTVVAALSFNGDACTLGGMNFRLRMHIGIHITAISIHNIYI